MRVEKEADECPSDGDVETGDGRYPAQGAEGDWEVDVALDAAGGAAGWMRIGAMKLRRKA